MTQDYTYWKNRQLDDPMRDWNYNEEDWIQGYVLSVGHPHRQLILDILKKIGHFGYLLEIGCNTGPNLALIRESYPENALFGMDASEIAIKKAKELLNNVELKIGDFENLPWPDKYFDVLLADSVLLYADPDKFKKVLSEINRVTERYVILIERYAPTIKGKLVGHVWGRNYKKIFEKLGFEVEETKITKGIWPTSLNWQKYGRLYVCHRV